MSAAAKMGYRFAGAYLNMWVWVGDGVIGWSCRFFVWLRLTNLTHHIPQT